MSKELVITIWGRNMVNGAVNGAKSALQGLKAGLGSMFGGIGNMFGGMAGMMGKGGLIGAALFGGGMALKSAADAAGNIKDLADATGLSTDKFQQFANIARLSGVEAGSLQGALMRLRDAQASIGTDKRAQEVFRKLGMSVEDVARATPDELLQRVAEQINKTGDASAAFDLFGRGAGRLIESLKQMAEEGANSKDALKGMVTAENIAALDAFGDKVDETKNRVKAFGINVAGDIVRGAGDFFGTMGYLMDPEGAAAKDRAESDKEAKKAQAEGRAKRAIADEQVAAAKREESKLAIEQRQEALKEDADKLTEETKKEKDLLAKAKESYAMTPSDRRTKREEARKERRLQHNIDLRSKRISSWYDQNQSDLAGLSDEQFAEAAKKAGFSKRSIEAMNIKRLQSEVPAQEKRLIAINEELKQHNKKLDELLTMKGG